MNSFGFKFGWSRERVEHRVCVSGRNRLLDQYIDGQAIFCMNHCHHSGIGTHLQRAQHLSVVGIQTTRVRHEQFDGGDSLAFDQ